jgi:hypothetical protein
MICVHLREGNGLALCLSPFAFCLYVSSYAEAEQEIGVKLIGVSVAIRLQCVETPFIDWTPVAAPVVSGNEAAAQAAFRPSTLVGRPL